MTRTSTTVKKIRKALATDTGEVINFNDLDIDTVRALTKAIANSDAPGKSVCTSPVYRDAKKALAALRKQSKRELTTQARIILRLEDPTFVLLATRGRTDNGKVLIPVAERRRKQMDAKEAAIYRLEKTLLRSVEGTVPAYLKKREQLEIEFA
jgi:hypothetical protein